MWNSFGGFPDGVGDTQPMDSQTFMEYSDLNTSRILGHGLIQGTGEHKTEGKTYHEGDTGHIDLVGCIEDTPVIRDEEQDEDDVSLDEDGDDADELGPEPHFRLPKTPATVGKKRDYRGQLISSDAKTSTTKTPGSALAAIFGNDKGVFGMSMTQAFNQTQAPSSPLPDGHRSDPVFQRPSPSVRQSSPPAVMSMSSSTKPLPNDLMTHDRIHSDPLDSYLTMKESQERRRRVEEIHMPFDDDDEDDFEEMTDAQRLAEQRRRKAKIQQQISKSCEGLTAPPRSSTKRLNKLARRRSATDISSNFSPVTPMTHGARKKKRNIILTSDDVVTDDDGEDELSQKVSGSAIQVPMTSSRPNGRSQPNGDAHYNSPLRSQSQRNPSQRFHHRQAESPSATQKTIAVADSQVDASQQKISLRTSADGVDIVSSSQVAQSQILSLQSEIGAPLSQKFIYIEDTSSVPRPPPPTTQVLEHESTRIPSSPPVLAAVVDVTMDDLETTNDVHLEDSRTGKPASEDRGTSVHEVILDSIPQTSRAQSPTRSRILQKDVDDSAHESQKENDPTQGQEDCDRASSGDTNLEEEEGTTAATTKRGSQLFETVSSSHPTISSPHKQNLGLAPGTRKLSDIAADHSQHQSFESVDIPNIMNQDDDDFFKATEPEYTPAKHKIASSLNSSPVRPNKRRKVITYGKRALREAAQNLNVQFSIQSDEAIEQQNISVEEKALTPVPASASASATVHEDRDEPAIAGSTLSPQLAKATKNPTDEVKVKGIAKKPVKPVSVKNVKVSKRASTAPGRPKPRSLRVLEIAETPQSKIGKSNHLGRQTPDNDGSEDQNPIFHEVAILSDTIPEQMVKPLPSVEVKAECVPTRVLARFRGNKMAYYPATCIGLAQLDGLRLKIRFDDGTVDDIETTHIRKLALQVGDCVKVDLPNMRTKTYVISGFKDKISFPTDSRDELTDPEPADYPATTTHGYLTAQLAVRPRDGLPTPDPTDEDTVDVPVSNIYVTSTMWVRFKDRKYIHSVEPPILRDRLTTPSVMLSGPSTPTSRSRRQQLPNLQTGQMLSFPAGFVRPQSRLFANMAFAVTFSDDGAGKNSSVKVVRDHGGLILDSGFDELFDVNVPEPQSPTRKAPKKTVIDNTSDVADPSTDALRLLPTAQKLGFTALIADRFCRRAKYMQALALDIPCLHHRWLHDCIAASAILPWQKYLLPAGESTFLSGAVRSRTLAFYDPLSDAATLENVLARRRLLLGDKSVLLVMGKGRAEERRKAYLFLTYALGASNVGRVRDLTDAKKLLDDGEVWDWVYVDGDEREAERVLFSADVTAVPVPATMKTKKRKREPSRDSTATAKSVGRNVKVVGDEFVIQSLILGALMEV
jgi:hypothetical protein